LLKARQGNEHSIAAEQMMPDLSLCKIAMGTFSAAFCWAMRYSKYPQEELETRPERD
jgi:hypothetical protein